MTRIAGIETTSDGEPTLMAKRILCDLAVYIERYEPEFLRMLLGPYVAENIDKYESIHNLLTEPATSSSVIAKYVYFHYSRDRITFNTPAGEKLKTTENSRNVLPSARLVRVWNEMVNECGHILSEIERLKQNQNPELSLFSLNEVRPDFDADIFRKINIYGL